MSNTTTITPGERAKLRRLAAKATKLPYFYAHNPDSLCHVVHSENHNEGSIGSWLWGRDARYVAAACNAVPELVNALEAAEARAEREIQRNVILAAQLEGMVHEHNEQKARAEKAEAENARLRAERDWLAENTADRPCAYDSCSFGLHRPTGPDDDDCDKTRAQCWKEAARRAVADESEVGE